MEDKLTRNHYKLIKRVMSLSHATNWDDAKKEWKIIEITEVDKDEDYGSCLCGKYPIKEMIQMFNGITRSEIIVGNCCVNKFFDIDKYNKVFNALKKNKVNSLMIDESYAKNIINSWEKNFMMSVWRKRNFTKKQVDKYKILSQKIIKFYKSKKEVKK